MKTELTEAEVVRVLAEREGWRKFPNDTHWRKPTVVRDGWHSVSCRKAFDYLTSRDALAPVLQKLTEKEWLRLDQLLCDAFCKSDITPVASSCGRRWLLTLPPRQLAFAIAEAIRKGEKGQP